MYYSDEGDEIMEYDNCGITVHEGNNPLLSLLFLCAPGHNLNTRGWKVDKSLSMVNWYSQNELPIKWFPHNYIKWSGEKLFEVKEKAVTVFIKNVEKGH